MTGVFAGLQAIGHSSFFGVASFELLKGGLQERLTVMCISLSVFLGDISYCPVIHNRFVEVRAPLDDDFANFKQRRSLAFLLTLRIRRGPRASFLLYS